ncbi:hypothetical protein [Faecalibaculum rodentium]|uniref:hypothetical protein n=1 Tax=Faecalibaculum rodentium TaxID=1702221 RepID=UPI00272F1422|nr:hypothetical protein [Faecalibaculum rodentium]
MISKKLQEFRNLLLEVTGKVYHYYHQAEDETYIVWTENGEGETQHGDNHKQEVALHFSVELFTKTEYSPVLDALTEKLNESRFAFEYTGVDFEVDTGYIHHSLEVYG